MNENIDLCEILRDCPKDTKFYSSIFGDVKIAIIKSNKDYPITIFAANRSIGPLCRLSKNGKYNNQFDGECTLFPSREQRDWSKFSAPWLKKEKFDPKTLKPFDKVLVFDSDRPWTPLMFSYLEYTLNYPRMQCFDFVARKVIPYNKETEHLLGTHNEAPDFYRYWED